MNLYELNTLIPFIKSKPFTTVEYFAEAASSFELIADVFEATGSRAKARNARESSEVNKVLLELELIKDLQNLNQED